MKEDTGIISKVEKKIGKAWKAFCKEYAAWETRLLECKQNDALALREWEMSKPVFDYPPKDLLLEIVRELTDGEGIVTWCWDERYVPEQGNEKGHVLREHLIEVNDKPVGYIHEKYYDDGTYTLDIEEVEEVKP